MKRERTVRELKNIDETIIDILEEDLANFDMRYVLKETSPCKTCACIGGFRAIRRGLEDVSANETRLIVMEDFGMTEDEVETLCFPDSVDDFLLNGLSLDDIDAKMAVKALKRVKTEDPSVFMWVNLIQEREEEKRNDN